MIAAAAASSAWMLALPFGAIGVPLMVAGAVMLRRRIRARLKGPLVEAEVVHREVHRVPVAAKRSPGGGAASTVTPTFKYSTADGDERFARLDHQAKQRLRSEAFRLRYPMGARVFVRIDPVRPGIAYDDKIVSMFVLPGLLVFAGTLMTLLALGIWFGA